MECKLPILIHLVQCIDDIPGAAVAFQASCSPTDLMQIDSHMKYGLMVVCAQGHRKYTLTDIGPVGHLAFVLDDAQTCCSGSREHGSQMLDVLQAVPSVDGQLVALP